ncbi:hypothetical protein K439DRAFT_344583 [Ramaria rubella]|nr:hypothetical protein K439DRAFT_344583 [Ramaria rubella]
MGIAPTHTDTPGSLISTSPSLAIYITVDTYGLATNFCMLRKFQGLHKYNLSHSLGFESMIRISCCFAKMSTFSRPRWERCFRQRFLLQLISFAITEREDARFNQLEAAATWPTLRPVEYSHRGHLGG